MQLLAWWGRLFGAGLKMGFVRLYAGKFVRDDAWIIPLLGTCYFVLDETTRAIPKLLAGQAATGLYGLSPARAMAGVALLIVGYSVLVAVYTCIQVTEQGMPHGLRRERRFLPVQFALITAIVSTPLAIANGASPLPTVMLAALSVGNAAIMSAVIYRARQSLV
jgi:hypothetical protein